MTTNATIRQKIADHFIAVLPDAKIHIYERYTSKMRELRKLYLVESEAEDKELFGGFIRRVNFTEDWDDAGNTRVTTNWKIRLYRSLEDEEKTELDFDTLIDQLVEVFRNDRHLGGIVFDTISESQAGLRLEDSGPVMFADVLCHSAHFGLQTVHLIPEEDQWALKGKMPTKAFVSHKPEIGAAHKGKYIQVSGEVEVDNA